MKNKLKAFIITFFTVYFIYIMYLCFFAFMCSCSTVKKVEKVKVNETVATTVDSIAKASKTETLKVTDKTEKFTDKSLIQIENETNELETRITEYDTDKPIVPGTNKSPLKKETITTNKKSSKTDTKSLDNSTSRSTSDANYTLELENSIQLLQAQNAKLIADTMSKESTTPTSWKWTVIIICIIALLYALTQLGVWPRLFVWVMKIFRVKD